MPNNGYEKLINYAFNLVSRKRYTEREILTKFAAYQKKHDEINEEVVEKVFERLKELKYIDDKQFAEDYFLSRVKSRPRGRAMIRLELIKKGVSKEHIEGAFNSVAIDEREIATDALLKKINKWRMLDLYAQKNKAYQFLYSKGFKPESIYKAIESCYDQVAN